MKAADSRTKISLTIEQQRVVDFVSPHIISPAFTPTVIHGVTGSGKTEIYKELIKTCIAQKKNALFLLPEVTLALEFEKRLRTELPEDIPIFSFHSGTSIKTSAYCGKIYSSKNRCSLLGCISPSFCPLLG